MAAREYGQYDGVTRALQLVGERWAVLIVRDLLVGPRRYGELAVATRPHEQVADEKQCPPLPHELERLGDTAVLPVVPCRHRPQACSLAKACGPCSAATGSIQPNSRMLPSGSLSVRWYMKP